MGRTQTPEQTYDAIRAHINGELRQLPRASRLLFLLRQFPESELLAALLYFEDRGGMMFVLG